MAVACAFDSKIEDDVIRMDTLLIELLEKTFSWPRPVKLQDGFGIEDSSWHLRRFVHTSSARIFASEDGFKELELAQDQLGISKALFPWIRG